MTTSIPIVMVRVGDPVDSGFVASPSRPGGNITGLSNLLGEAASKYVEFLQATGLTLSRATVLANPMNPIHRDYFQRVQAAARANTVAISASQASTRERSKQPSLQ